MSTMIYSFTTSESPKISEVGGKAKALIETTKSGFPVPKGIVLSVHFFASWLEEVKLSSEWASLAASVTKEKCDALKSKAHELRFTDSEVR